MNSTKFQERGLRLQRSTPLIVFIVAIAVLMIPSHAIAQTAAGTAIGNQASATYTDSSSVSRTATSNVVTTVVQQVASLTQPRTGQRQHRPVRQCFIRTHW